jgi:hypothetical protein
MLNNIISLILSQDDKAKKPSTSSFSLCPSQRKTFLDAMQKCFEEIFPSLQFVYFVISAESGRVKECGVSSLSSPIGSSSSDSTALVSGTFSYFHAENDAVTGSSGKDIRLADETTVAPLLFYPNLSVDIRGCPETILDKLRREKERKMIGTHRDLQEGIHMSDQHLPMSPLSLADEGEGDREGESAFPLSFFRNFVFLTILSEGKSQIWTYNWGTKQVSNFFFHFRTICFYMDVFYFPRLPACRTHWIFFSHSSRFVLCS